MASFSAEVRCVIPLELPVLPPLCVAGVESGETVVTGGEFKCDW